MIGDILNKDIIVTGIGMIGDFGVGKDDFKEFLAAKKPKIKLADINFDDYIDTGNLRRADPTSLLASVAAKLAVCDANLNFYNAPAERRGIVLGTMHGALGFTEDYHKDLVLGNPKMVSPLLFSNSVLNVMASYISTIFNIKGFSTTIVGHNSVFSSIKCAVDLLLADIVDVCIVGGVDVYREILNEPYSCCLDNMDLLTNYFGGSGMLILQKADYQNKTAIRVLKKGEFKEDFDCLIASCYDNQACKKKQNELLKNIGRKKPVIDCSSWFGSTFSSAEIFKVILGIMLLNKEVNLGVNQPDNILINSINKTGSFNTVQLVICH